MGSQERTTISQEPEDYRGALVYRQEYGYKLITLIVSVASDEQSHVTSHAYNLPISEDAEHLQGVDLYHFAMNDGARIQLTIDTPMGSKEAWYTVCRDDIEAQHSPHFWLDIVESSEGRKVPSLEPQTSHDWQVAFHDLLYYYGDNIPQWLDAHDRHATTFSEPFHDFK